MGCGGFCFWFCAVFARVFVLFFAASVDRAMTQVSARFERRVLYMLVAYFTKVELVKVPP
jgi:hypothetical protein